jgi:hypothetical protein
MRKESIKFSFLAKIKAELHSILDYWETNAIDEKFGRFIGE